MASVYTDDNFHGRVNYASLVISRKGTNTRHFDTCFEMFDGDEVVAALVRRAAKNPRLAANLFDYIREDSAKEVTQRLAHVSNLSRHAAETRARRKREFDTFMANR